MFKLFFDNSLTELPRARLREYGLDVKNDAQGNLAKFIKSPWFGQVFVSRARLGVSRGNHYRHTKTRSSS